MLRCPAASSAARERAGVVPERHRGTDESRAILRRDDPTAGRPTGVELDQQLGRLPVDHDVAMDRQCAIGEHLEIDAPRQVREPESPVAIGRGGRAWVMRQVRGRPTHEGADGAAAVGMHHPTMQHGGAFEHDEQVVEWCAHRDALRAMLWAEAQQFDELVARSSQLEPTEVVASRSTTCRRVIVRRQSVQDEDGVGDRQAGRVLDAAADRRDGVHWEDAGLANRRPRTSLQVRRRRRTRRGCVARSLRIGKHQPRALVVP